MSNIAMLSNSGHPSKRSKSQKFTHERRKNYSGKEDETFGFMNDENSGIFILPQLDSSEPPQKKMKMTKS